MKTILSLRIKPLSLFVCLLLASFFASAAIIEVAAGGKNIKIPFYDGNAPKQGAVILLSGDHPPCSKLTQKMAEQFSNLGWDVAAVNCCTDEVKHSELMPEIMSHLRKNKNQKISVIHYGNRLSESLDYFNQQKSKRIDSLVLISAFDLKEQEVRAPDVPVFDITGQFDWAPVHEAKATRKTTWKKNDYISIMLSGATHDYEYQINRLTSYIHGYMKRLPETKAVSLPILQSSIPNYRFT